MNIVILERESVGLDVDMTCFEAFGDVTVYANTKGEAQTAERVKDADIVIVNKAPMNARTLGGAPRVKMIAITATGYDICDLDYCRSRGIRVANVAGYSTAMVAQHTFALALALSQKLVAYDRFVKDGGYAAQDSFTVFSDAFCEMDGKTWGIVGLGAIGVRVARIADALGCRVIVHSPTGRAHAGYENVSKNELLARSDFLSLHCPLSDLSRGFIDADALRRMKKTAYLINVARGPVVVGRDLAKALEAGEIAGAGLDVLEQEPMRPDDPLLAIQDSRRLIITPHIGWASVEARQRCVQGTYENVAAFLRGEARGVVC